MTQLSLITGAPAALDDALAAEVRRHKAGRPLAPVSILVGGTLLRPYLRGRLAELLAGHINVPIVTPAELGLRLGELGMVAGGRLPITPLADRALAHEIGRTADPYFRPVRDTPGFANALHRLFGELRAANIEPDQLGGGDLKRDELAELYRGYLLARGQFFDATDAMGAPDVARADDVAVVVHGIWDVSARLRALLEALAERIPVTVFLPVTGSVADDAHAETRAWLTERGAIARHVPSPQEPQTPLASLQSGLFADLPVPAAPGDGVELVSAPDPAREAREAVRACLAWARRGIRFHEMAIVYRQGREYRSLIDQALREPGIPAYVHEGTPLSERPLGRQALALLELVESNLPRTGVMQFIADARLPDETWERYGGVSAATWDTLSRRGGVVEGPAQWEQRLGLLRTGLTEREVDDEQQREWLTRRIGEVDRLTSFVADLVKAFERRPRSASWAEHLGWLAGLFATYLHSSKRLIGALATLADLDALGRPASSERFLEVVRAAIEGLRVSDVSDERQGAFARRGVNVLDVNSLRHLSFRAVAIVGLVERSFPPPPRQDALLLDDEREQLARTGIVLPLRARGADNEALQFALALSAAREHLLLSFARAESAGKRSQLPSRFFRDAAQALCGEPVTAARVDELPTWFYRRLAGNRLAGTETGRALSPDEYDRGLLEAHRPLAIALLSRSNPTFVRALAQHQARWHSPKLTSFDGVLGPDTLDALSERVGADRPLSPTGLESYASCPYRFFLEKVIGLKELEEPEAVERIDALNRGSLIHRVLQRFLEELGGARPSDSRRAADVRKLLEIAGEECRLVEERGLTGYPVLWRHDRRSLLEDLASWYEHESDDEENGRYDKAAYEVRFGRAWADEETSPMSIDDPIEIDADGARLRLHGRIDRLEWSTGKRGFRVIDYKSGSTWGAPETDSVEGGRALQLPLYLLAGAQLLDRRPQDGVAEYFYASRRGDFERIAFSGGVIGANGVDVPGLIGSLLTGMRAGDFHAEPGDCGYCPFDRLCDSSRVKLRARKASDPRIVAFDLLAEEHP